MAYRIPSDLGTHRKLQLFLRNTISIGVGTGCFAFIFLSNGGLIDETRKWYQLYEKDGTPKRMDSKLAELCLKALQDTRMSKERKLHSKFFHVNDTDVFSAGSYEFRQGTVIGVPFSFTFNSVKEIDTNLIPTPFSSSQKIDWNSDAGRRLLESLILSEEAKKFAIAKEIYFSNNYRILFKSIVAALLSWFPAMVNELYLKGQGKAVSLRMVLLLYAATIPLAITKFFMFDHLTSEYYSSKADKLAANLTDEYRKGAIEYYKKKLMANKAWRDLLGKEGPRFYTDCGDEIGFVATKRISQKLKFFEAENSKTPDDGLDKVSTEKMIQ